MTGRMTHLRAFLALLALLFTALAAPVASETLMPETRPVALDRSDPQRDQVGGLAFRGAVEVLPGEAGIGGISALAWDDGRLLALADDGRWFAMTPDEPGGRLTDIVAIEDGALHDLKGRKLRRKSEADAEALTRGREGGWLVSFEREHRIWRYDQIGGRASDPALAIADLAFGADENKGIEALALSPDGLLACGEWAGTATPNCMRERGGGLVSFDLSPPQEWAGRGAVPTDAACNSAGTCYVLFRSYSPDAGNAAAIVALAPDNSASTLAAFLPPVTLDNFEALAIREEAGRTYLYIASDNNFSRSQRTLVMKFELLSARKDTDLPPPPSTAIDSATYETTSVVLETERGEIVIALETERAPITAGNFLRYVDEGRLDGTVFYRAMRLDREPRPNGLIQGGTQWDPKRVLPGIRHEPTTETGLSHTSGALSMAMGEPGTANGDFSIMLQDQTGLDANPDAQDPVFRHGYAVFGYVTRGMDVVAKIHGATIDPDKGEGWMKGQMIAEPVRIIRARRAE